MSIGQIVVLTAIVAAFVVFAAVLAWGDYHAQQLARRIRDREGKGAALAPGATAVKQADKAAVAGTAQARWPQASDDGLQNVA